MDATCDGRTRSTNCGLFERYDLNQKRVSLPRPETTSFISKIEWSAVSKKPFASQTKGTHYLTKHCSSSFPC